MARVKRHWAVVVIIALLTAACTQATAPSGRVGPPTAAPTSTALVTEAPSASSATPAPTATPTPEIGFRALDTPDRYSRSSAEAVDGTTAVGWVQVHIEDEQPAIWDTTTGALQVLTLPADFIHPNGDTFVRLVGVSGTTAVGTGVLGKGTRGQTRAMAWDTETGDLRILDIPAGFTQAEARAISGTTAVGQVWTAHGESGRPVSWDTATGAVRILKVPADVECANPLAMSGDTIVGTRCDRDDALPLVWSPITTEARGLDLLASTHDGVPRAVDGTTAVGNCCVGEEGTPVPLLWDTASGSVRRLDLPAPHVNGLAVGVSGTVAIGTADFKSLVWGLYTGVAVELATQDPYSDSNGVHAVSGRTIVGRACQPPASSSENPRCVAAAWTLP
jgi:hypothetical protein